MFIFSLVYVQEDLIILQVLLSQKLIKMKSKFTIDSSAK